MQNSTRGDVDPFIVMDVMEAARLAEQQGRHIIHMEIGQPGKGAPKEALERLGADMKADSLGYTVALGLPELRARIARHYGEWYDVDLDPERVVITSGASGGFLLAFAAFFEAGQRVGLGTPSYPSYRHILQAMSLEAVGLETRLDHGLQPRAAQIEGASLDGLIIASPGNPTGTMLGRSELADIVAACARASTALISDEIYHGLSYGERSVSALEFTGNTCIINSFSKYFCMTGWRVGWMVVPEDNIRQVEKLAQNMFICAPHASQRLALHAFECKEELDENVAAYGRNRAVLLAALREAGLSTFAPSDGAFYIYADIRHLSEDALALSRQILHEADVSVTPGNDFDAKDGRHWLRFSYARSEADIIEGAARLKRFFTQC